MRSEVLKILSHFNRPSKATRRLASQMFSVPNAALIETLIQKNRIPMTPEDKLLMDSTQQQAREIIKRGRHHLFCQILGGSGKYHPGIQETYPRDADCETCAEPGAISNLDIARDVPITVCTIHYMPIPERGGDGVTTIVPPCLRCAGRLRHLAERHKTEFGIMIYHNKEVIKISSGVVHLLQYPNEYHYGNGDSK